MRRRSLKWRLTVWFTLCLTLISLLILFTAAATYRMSDLQSTRRSLVEVVHDRARRMSSPKGRMGLPDGPGDGSQSRQSVPEASQSLPELPQGEQPMEDRDYFQDEIQVMVYHADGSHAFGLFLVDGFDEVPFSDAKEPRELEIDGKTYLYYDEELKNASEEGMWVRGVTYDRGSGLELLRSHWYVLVVIPVLIGLAFAGGYWLTGRFLRPVQEISRTAEEIRVSGDLTKRIPVSDAGDELSELGRTFNAMFDRVEENFEAEKRFTSNASHELRTPVAVIMAQCEYALEGEEGPEELREALASVQKQGYRMSHLIETLLVFTRMEQSTEKYPVSATPIAELTRSVCEDFQLIADRGITVSCTCPERLSARVNRELYLLLLNNLMTNAIRYGRENGSVTVRLWKEGESILLRVQDDGIGIAEAELGKIWERFYRSDQSRSTRGLGLGLPLVKQIAEYHGGSVSVESRVGEGSAFTVRLRGGGEPTSE